MTTYPLDTDTLESVQDHISRVLTVYQANRREKQRLLQRMAALEFAMAERENLLEALRQTERKLLDCPGTGLP